MGAGAFRGQCGKGLIRTEAAAKGDGNYEKSRRSGTDNKAAGIPGRGTGAKSPDRGAGTKSPGRDILAKTGAAAESAGSIKTPCGVGMPAASRSGRRGNTVKPAGFVAEYAKTVGSSSGRKRKRLFHSV